MKPKILLLFLSIGLYSCTFDLRPDIPDFHFNYCLNGEQFTFDGYHSISMREGTEFFLQPTRNSGKAFFKMSIIEPFQLRVEYVGNEEFFIDGEKYLLSEKNVYSPESLIDGWFSLNSTENSGIAFTVAFGLSFTPMTSYGDEISSLSGTVDVSRRYMDGKKDGIKKKYSELIKSE